MNSNINIFKRRNTYSFIILILVLLAEIFVIIGLRNNNPCLMIWPSIVLVPIIVLGIIGWFYAKHEFLPTSTVFTDLMANAITPSWLGALYLLFFIVHIAWISDGTLNYFRYGLEGINEVSIAVGVGTLGMFILICFFPEARVKKTDDGRKKVFVSGISQFPSAPNPYTHNPNDYKSFNLRPLVRILQLAEEKCEECEILILKTDVYSEDVKNICLDNAEEMRLNSFEDADLEMYGVKPLKAEGKIHVDSKLEYIIKRVAWKEFVEDVEHADNSKRKEKEDWIKNRVSIHFTNPCNYNNYVSCFKTLNKSLQDYDTKDLMFYMNLTPGTVVVSSVITLLSIDSDRELYYYSQEKGMLDRERLMHVDKKHVPLSNLLSQAMKTIKENG